MLLGTIVAYPQPPAINCWVAGGSPPVSPPRPPGRVVGRVAGPGAPGRAGAVRGKPPNPNIIITGTGALASAGVTSVIWMSTLICGHEALSTWPTSCFTTVARVPAVPSDVVVT